ncbi:hypothetical protein [Chitinophaga nivalis]|uniref:Nudix hydrolase domain-containing protein n=1 Tax=Chitinophaga nivalis TaxID=2991709 RepID=A0ABT3II74_9BACT|nr:hypothetical protein [Chitinophaga nivalis]MCW3466641.1 hypothetical protein [Chitinophaga nivalis]MCW3483668.1 hypothetical protein [Chitinophaga nivalis]
MHTTYMDAFKNLNYIELVVGALLGWVLNEICTPIKKKVIQRIREKKLKRLLNNDTLINDPHVLVLDRAIPYYDPKGGIKLRCTQQNLFISFPQKYKTAFRAYDFVYREQEIFDGRTDIATLLEKMGISNAQKRLDDATATTALDFLRDFKAGQNRFNSLISGIYKLRTTRLNTEEKSGLDMQFYTTDYFTYRVFSNLYQSLLNDHQAMKIEKPADINLYNVFFSSFGICTFIIINRGNGDEVILGKRSDAVMVERNKWHYSMNEAFNARDKDEYGHPSFHACVYRGLEEELGIGERYQKNIKKLEFFDLVLLTNRLESGITSYVRLQLDENLSFDELMGLYRIAQDSALETVALEVLPVRKIDQFIQQHSTDISDGCRHALRALHARYKAGYLRDEE